MAIKSKDIIQVFDPSHLFSARIKRWEPAAIRSLLPLEDLPGMISLLAGKPNPSTFPFSSISMSVRDSNVTLSLDDTALDHALQYGLPGGDSDLIEWFKELQQNVHGLELVHKALHCCVGSGSQDLLYKAFQVFTDPGDSILIETPAYSGTLGFLRADGHNLVEVQSDQDGLIPSDLERILTEWPGGCRRPSVLYSVPTGGNPTGRSCTNSRKEQILRLAKKFDIVIFEDDPYYYLNFADSPTKLRSYLSLEAEINLEAGRVIRFDSLSKIISSGMRLGFLTGSSLVIEKVNMITANTNLQPSSTTQILALALFRQWKHSGFLSHCATVADFYKSKRDIFAAAAEHHLREKADWEVPTAGMFFWLRLRLPPGKDSFELVSKQGVESRILAVPGVAFMPKGGKTCHLRASYSLLTEEEAYEACRRIARLFDSIIL